MKNKKLFFAALFFAALAFGFVGCENPDSESGISIEKPTTPEVPTLVTTGGATEVGYSSITLWGRINTDTLWAFSNIKWGIECSTSKEEMQSHKGKKVLCTTDLVGENSDEYSVAFTELTGGKMLYYNAYLVINDMKYIYGEADSVHLDVKLTLNRNNTSYGTVTGSGTYDHLAEVTITATPKENYYFAGWSDSDSKELTRTVQVNSDTTITAIFSEEPYLTAKPNNSNYGTVTGSGHYAVGSEATITATPKESYYFTGWSDCDSKELTRTVQVNSDTTITANFAKNPYLTAKPNSSDYGTVTGSGYYDVGAEATITATPKENYYFTGWSDSDSKELTRTVQVNSDTIITANFAKMLYLTVKSNNSNFGTVEGSGYYELNTEVTITATPNYYTEFVQWSDGNTENPRTVTVTSNVTYVAEFKVSYTSNFTPAAFSVSSTNQVYFSPGNLQYHPKNDEWRFAPSQLDYICEANENISSTYNGWLDLFGWSTSATNFGVSTSTSSSNYSGSFVDWGTNQIGSDAPNTWRTLTYAEWRYLLNNRLNASSLMGVAQVNGVNGLILLPDSWTCPDGITFKSGFHDDEGVEYYAAYQTFTAAEWSKMEVAGAVFLPAAGRRYGSVVYYVQDDGYCWSATEYKSNEVCFLFFDSDEAYMHDNYRYYGFGVRLVKDL